MERSEQINEIAAALAKAHTELKNPSRNREVKVTSKRTGATYKFKYATLDAILEQVRPILAANGMAIVQGVQMRGERDAVLATTLVHSSGQWMRSEIPLGGLGMPNQEPGGSQELRPNQELGSEISYKRRYSVIAMLSLAADDDDDANIADGNTMQQNRNTRTETALPDVSAPYTPVTHASPAKAALAPVFKAADTLNALADEFTLRCGRDVKQVRKEVKQLLRGQFPDFDAKTATEEVTAEVVSWLRSTWTETEREGSSE